jgi:hypothetical protein
MAQSGSNALDASCLVFDFAQAESGELLRGLSARCALGFTHYYIVPFFFYGLGGCILLIFHGRIVVGSNNQVQSFAQRCSCKLIGTAKIGAILAHLCLYFIKTRQRFDKMLIFLNSANRFFCKYKFCKQTLSLNT